MGIKCAEHEEYAFFGDVRLRCVFPQVTSVHIHLPCDQPRVSFLKQWHHLHIKYIYIHIIPKSWQFPCGLWCSNNEHSVILFHKPQFICIYPLVSTGSSAPTCYIDPYCQIWPFETYPKSDTTCWMIIPREGENLKQCSFVPHHNKMVFTPIL